MIFTDRSIGVCNAQLMISGAHITHSSLRLVTVKHAYKLLEFGKTIINIVKNGPSKHPIVLTDNSLQLWRLCQPKIQRLCHHKTKMDYLFTGMHKLPHLPPSVDIVRRFLNKTLKEVSEELGLHIRTHSFRVSIITDLLENSPIHSVQKVIGHTNIQSTVTYSKNTVDYLNMGSLMGQERSFLHSML